MHEGNEGLCTGKRARQVLKGKLATIVIKANVLRPSREEECVLDRAISEAAIGRISTEG